MHLLHQKHALKITGIRSKGKIVIICTEHDDDDNIVLYILKSIFLLG